MDLQTKLNDVAPIILTVTFFSIQILLTLAR